MVVGQVHPLLRYIRRLAGSGADGPTDGQLLDEYVRCGNEAAFAALVKRHGAMVHGVCRRVLGNCHDADDAFQAVFLVLIRKAPKIVKRESVGSWLHGVARRTALKARAATSRRREIENEAAVANLQRTPSAVLWQELGPILDEEIARLPEKYRLLFVLCYLEGKTNAEAAHHLGWPMGTVATRLARGRERLRKRLTLRDVSLAGGWPPALESRAVFSGSAAPRVDGSLMDCALRMARSNAAFGVGCSERATALANGVERAMAISKARMAVLVCALTTLMAGGAGAALQKVLGAHQGLQQGAAATQANKKATVDESKNETAPQQPKDNADLDKVGKVLIARRDYQRSLEILRAHYLKTGDLERTRWAEQELRDYHRINHQAYRLDLDVPPQTLAPTTDIKEADDLIVRAKVYKDQGSGDAYIDNQRRAELLLQQVLTQYPTSLKIGEAAYLLGDLYESKAFGQFRRAAMYYDRCFQWNPKTPFDARLRAARIYDRVLQEPARAIEIYKKIINYETDAARIEEAQKRLKDLRGNKQ